MSVCHQLFKIFLAAVLVVVNACICISVASARSAERLAVADRMTTDKSNCSHIGLSVYLRAHPCTIMLVGDGTSTSHCKLLLVDKETGKASETVLHTVCASRKSLKPPANFEDAQKKGLTYHLGKTNNSVLATVQAAKQLSESGAYEGLAIPAERRQSTVAQLAIWKTLAGKTPASVDAVSTQSIKSDLLSRAKVDPASLSPQENASLDNKVDDIFNAVDLTCKTSTTVTVEEQPKTPGKGTTGGGLTEEGDGGTDLIGGGGGKTNGGGDTTWYIDVPYGTTFVSDNPQYQDITTVDQPVPTTRERTGNGEYATGSGLDGGTPTGPGTHTTDGGGTIVENGGGSTVGLVTPSGGDGGTIERLPKTPAKVPKKFGVALRRLDDEWVPRNINHTEVFAQIYEQQGQKWVLSDTPATITFHFVKRSNEPGDCLNHSAGMLDLPDLYFRAAYNPELDCLDNSPGQDLAFYCDTAKTKKQVLSQKVRIDCEDYGAYSTVEATAENCCPLKYVDEQNVTGPVTPEQAWVKVPKDDNNNQIADGYVGTAGPSPDIDKKDNPKATDDLDDHPVGNGVAGDGLSAYEEYRGFFMQGRHHRTSWKKKDLFIYDRANLPLLNFPSKSGIECHFISEDEYDANRVINFHSGNANVVKQHGLLMETSAINPDYGGLTSGIGPPKNVEWVRIQSAGSISGWAVPHELGHATGVRHHGDGFWGERNKTIYPSNAFWRLCGVDLPETFRIGTKHNEGSGSWNCIMRYSYRPRTIYEVGSSRMCAPTGIELQYFCESPTGTHFNEEDQFAGDAALGDCAHQFIVNDK